jgi:hypothetical protein
MDYRDKPPSHETGSRFNRRNRSNWVRIQPALTADAGVAYLDAQLRAAAAGRNEHATAGGRVVDCVAYQVPQHAGQQNRVAESHAPRRSDEKGDSFQPCRFSKLRREILENGTQRYGKMQPWRALAQRALDSAGPNSVRRERWTISLCAPRPLERFAGA